LKLHFGHRISKTFSSPFDSSPSSLLLLLDHQVSSGKMLFRLAIPLPPILSYLENHKILQYNDKTNTTTNNNSSNCDITFTHVVVKACAMAIAELPSLNGHVVMNQFYRSKTTGVDMSVFVDVNSGADDQQDESLSTSGGTIAVKVSQAEEKEVDKIAQDIHQTVAMHHQEFTAYQQRCNSLPTIVSEVIECIFPSFLRAYLYDCLHNLGNRYGIACTLPGLALLGIVPYPYGVCTVVTSPDAEQDIDVSFLTSPMDSSAPIVVTLGGYRVMPILDTDGRMQGNPVVNVGVAIHNQAATGQEAKQFLELLRKFLSDPLMMEEAYKERIRQKEIRAKAMLDASEF